MGQQPRRRAALPPGIVDLLPLVAASPGAAPPLDAILQAAADGITVQDAGGAVVYANAAAARLSGFSSAAEMLAAPRDEIVARFAVYDEAGEPFPLGRLPGRRVVAGESSAQATLRFVVNATGEERWSVVRATAARAAGGTARYAINVFLDITERALGEQRQRFLVEASRELASSLDTATTLQRVADLAVPVLADWCALDLRMPDGAIRNVAVAHTDPAKVARARELQRRYPVDPDAPTGVPNVLRTGQTEVYPEITDEVLVAAAADAEQLAMLRAVGFRAILIVPLTARGRTLGALSLVWAESGRRIGSAERATSEQLARAAALAIDNARLYEEARALAEARDREGAVAEAERRRLERLIEVLPEGVLLADAAGTVVMANEAALALTGTASRGERWPYRGIDPLAKADVRTPDGHPVSPEALPLPRSVREGEVVRGEQLLIRRADDGRDVALLVSSAPVRDGAGRITGAVKVFQDISAIKELEQQKDRFLAAVSHDLKNPLMAIKGQAQLSRRRLERRGALEPAQALESLRRIEESAARLTSMVDELLDAARLQMGRTLELDRRPTDLAALARRVAEEYATSARRHIRLVVPEGAVMAEWDGVRLGRVLDNLVSNAVKYSPEDSEIVLTIEREDRDGADWVAVRVRDEGMGIPAGDLPHIFEHFRRGSNVRGRVTGVGIGLAGARKIIEQHGGAMDVESREGGGSTFTVRIPLGGATAAGAERDEEP